jgi:hypothetical protein
MNCKMMLIVVLLLVSSGVCLSQEEGMVRYLVTGSKTGYSMQALIGIL